MAFQFIIKLGYLGAESVSLVMVADDDTVDEYQDGTLLGHYESFEEWAGGAEPPFNELERLISPECRHKLNNVEVVWDNTDPTHLKVGDQVFTVRPRARITDAPVPVRRWRKPNNNPNQGRLFQEGA